MTWIQVIELQTDRVDEFDAVLDDRFTESKDWRTATRSVRTRDRNRADTYHSVATCSITWWGWSWRKARTV
jgi:hypothetical protein